MAMRFARGKYVLKNPEKYIGIKTPTYRSGWEQAFMRLCDEHPNVAKWASESIKIPYRHPWRIHKIFPDTSLQRFPE